MSAIRLKPSIPSLAARFSVSGLQIGIGFKDSLHIRPKGLAEIGRKSMGLRADLRVRASTEPLRTRQRNRNETLLLVNGTACPRQRKVRPRAGRTASPTRRNREPVEK